MIAREKLLERDEVAERLAHLLTVDRNHVVVNPILSRVVAERRRRLRDLAFVMRKHQVHTAAVDVEPLAQVFGAHGRTLHVPAGEAVAPGRRPAHDMLRRSLLPEGEIARMALIALPVQLARVRQNIVEVAARKTAVAVFPVVFLHIEIDRPVRFVGETVVENLLHHGDLLDDMAAGAGFDRGGQHVQLVHRPVVTLRVIVRHFHRFELLQPRLLRNLVLTVIGIVLQMSHVGHVAHVAHFVAERPEITEQQVEGHRRPGVSQMRIAIYGRSADIHSHMRGIDRLEGFLAAVERVVKGQFRFHNKQYLPSHKINIFPTKTVKTKTKFAVPPSFGATRSRPDTA